MLERVSTRLCEMLLESARLTGCVGWRVEIEFRSAAAPWKRKHYPDESYLDVYLFLSPDLLQLSESQLTSLLARSAMLAGAESGMIDSDFSAVRPEAQPLLELRAIPSQGVGDSWSSSADVDAYAKAARLIGDLAEPWLRKAQLTTSWPMLELIPRRDVRQIRPVREARGYEVPLPKGFARLPAEDRARLVADDFETALRLRVAGDGTGQEAVVDGFGAWIAGTGLKLQLRTAKLRRSRAEPWLRIEYEADVEGGRCRALVGDGSAPDVRSDWLPVGGGAASLLHMEPNVDFGWRADGQAWLAPLGARPKRLIFDPRTSAEVAGEDDGELPTAHSAFSAHFTDPLYEDVDAEFGPFGSDEGYEMVWEWAERRAELEAAGSVPLILETEPDDLRRWLQPALADADPASLVDEATLVQSAGFTLLRLTGQLALEDQAMVLDALALLIAHYDAPEYIRQRDDLARWAG